MHRGRECEHEHPGRALLRARAALRSRPEIGSASGAAPELARRARARRPRPLGVELDLGDRGRPSAIRGCVHRPQRGRRSPRGDGERQRGGGRVRRDFVRERRRRRRADTPRTAAGDVLGQADRAMPRPDASQAIGDAIQAARRSRRSGSSGRPGSSALARRARSSRRSAGGAEIAVGWVGDSRAYWFDPEDARQLTVDDSWAGGEDREGLLTPEQAATSPCLHSITHWVGPDAAGRGRRASSLCARSGPAASCCAPTGCGITRPAPASSVG